MAVNIRWIKGRRFHYRQQERRDGPGLAGSYKREGAPGLLLATRGLKMSGRLKWDEIREVDLTDD